MLNYTSQAEGEGQSLGLREGIWGGEKKQVVRGDPNSTLLVWLMPLKPLQAGSWL